MPKIDVRSQTGAAAGSVDLDEATFGIEPNTAVMHQVVTAQLAARRAGTQSTLTRAERFAEGLSVLEGEPTDNVDRARGRGSAAAHFCKDFGNVVDQRAARHGAVC